MYIASGARVLCALGLLLVLAGCGEGESDAPQLGTVTGTVTSGGQPVVGATVTFLPDSASGTVGPASTGSTDESGKYSLTGSGDAGAVVGTHKVSIACPMITSSASGEAPPAGACNLPAEVSSIDTTPLTREVKAGDNTIDFDL